MSLFNSDDAWREARAEARLEFKKTRYRYSACVDRLCGADDCSNCHPENFQDGVYSESIEEDES